MQDRSQNLVGYLNIQQILPNTCIRGSRMHIVATIWSIHCPKLLLLTLGIIHLPWRITICAWKSIRQQADTIACIGEKPTGNQVYLKLLGKNNLVLNLRDLKYESGVHNLRFATRVLIMRELKDMNSDTERLLDNEIGAYDALQIPVLKLSDRAFVLYHARFSWEKGFQGSKRND